jgi:hypothetical protein
MRCILITDRCFQLRGAFSDSDLEGAELEKAAVQVEWLERAQGQRSISLDCYLSTLILSTQHINR